MSLLNDVGLVSDQASSPKALPKGPQTVHVPGYNRNTMHSTNNDTFGVSRAIAADSQVQYDHSSTPQEVWCFLWWQRRECGVRSLQTPVLIFCLSYTHTSAHRRTHPHRHTHTHNKNTFCRATTDVIWYTWMRRGGWPSLVLTFAYTRRESHWIRYWTPIFRLVWTAKGRLYCSNTNNHRIHLGKIERT